ncbi:hypothetical protein CK203_066315 [Vitis vinifera]|uniref:Retrotransposon gag domain-containing protein n=1 Tax=Vitis vinifera TaxID=29760 RepID=A0A438FP91_VITVI|nr:hypothetical protein CK203_066315 [Vitis vinifera]
MATPSRSRSSGRREEDNFEWRQTIERRQLARERQLKALLQETERLREKNVVLRIQATTSWPLVVAFKRPSSKLKVRTRINLSWDNRSYPRSMQPKRQRDKKSQLSNSMRARLDPQEPGRSRPPVTTTWAPRPDPMVTPVEQNVHPHRDPMVTSMMRNVHSQLALMTLDIGNDALLCKVFPASLQGHALSWFHRLPPNSVGNFRDLSKAFVGQYLCSARHKQNISTLQT